MLVDSPESGPLVLWRMSLLISALFAPDDYAGRLSETKAMGSPSAYLPVHNNITRGAARDNPSQKIVAAIGDPTPA